MEPSKILRVQPSEDYALLDSGDGMKLERYGAFVLARPDPQALWHRLSDESEWVRAHAQFTRNGKEGEWHIRPETPRSWTIVYAGLTFSIRPTSFKHTGLFPEQKAHWDWFRGLIRNAGRPIKVLNLFAYTGGASLAAAEAGAFVTHVDASKVSNAWAKENARLSNIPADGIRFITDDVLAFVEREIRRGSKYDAIIMDPPAFGRGPKGEVWRIEESLAPLIEKTMQLLSPTPLFFLMSGYAAGYSPMTFENMIRPLCESRHGTVSSGEIALVEIHDGAERPLACGMYARSIF